MASASITRIWVNGSSSGPPQARGITMPKTPASCIAVATDGGRRRSASAASLAALICPVSPIAACRTGGSSWVALPTWHVIDQTSLGRRTWIGIAVFCSATTPRAGYANWFTCPARHHENLEWAVRLALECRRRVKEQQKRIGSAEFRNTRFSYSVGLDGVEKFVATPELQSDDSIGPEPLKHGQVWAISPGGQD